MIDLIRLFFKWIFANKWKLLVLPFFILIWIILLFPFKDLSDFVSGQVSTLTQDAVSLQFEDISLGLFPIGVELSNVNIENRFTPPIRCDSVRAHPSLWSLLITKQPGGSIGITNFLGADLDASLATGKKTQEGEATKSVKVEIAHLALAKVSEFAKLSTPIKGSLDADAQGELDLTLKVQPDVDFNLKFKDFEVPQSNVSTPMGPLILPDIKISSGEGKGRLSDGKILVESLHLGGPADDLDATVKGHLVLTFQANRNPLWGPYEFEVNLSVKKALAERASVIFSMVDIFIGKFKTQIPEGSRYSFKASGTNFYTPARFDSLK